MNPSGGSDAEGLVVALVRYRRLVVRVFLLSVVSGLAAAYLIPASWTARGSFVAQDGSPESLGQLAGLASQFGVNIGAVSGGYPPRFYAALVTSDEILGTVADQPFADSAGQSIPVARALGMKPEEPAILRARAIERLQRRVVSAMYDQRTGLTEFSVRTTSPALSTQIARAIVDEVNRFNAERHRSQASEERQFIESRRDAIAHELSSAEETLRTFLAENRLFESSPSLVLEHSRLERRVMELQGVFSSLSQSFEQARIEEVRDTPVLTLVESPTQPVLPDPRPIVEWTVAAAALALIAALGGIVSLQLLGALPRSRPDDPTSLAEAWPILRTEITRPWRLVF